MDKSLIHHGDTQDNKSDGYEQFSPLMRMIKTSTIPRIKPDHTYALLDNLGKFKRDHTYAVTDYSNLDSLEVKNSREVSDTANSFGEKFIRQPSIGPQTLNHEDSSEDSIGVETNQIKNVEPESDSSNMEMDTTEEDSSSSLHPINYGESGQVSIGIGTNQYKREKPESDTSNIEMGQLQTEEDIYQCPICDTRSPSISSVISHLNVHTGKKPHACSLCKEVFNAPSHLRLHLMRHVANKEKMSDLSIKCPLCLQRSYALETHLLKHIGAYRPYKCDICGLEFQLPRDLKDHLMTLAKTNLHQCDKCKRGFKGIDWKEHKKSCPFYETPYKCNKCDKKFRLKSVLLSHQQNHSTVRKVHKCQICKKQIGSGADAFNRHMLSHSLDIKYACDVCGKRFAFHGALKNHIEKTHSVHECPMCKKSFRGKVYLESHMNSSMRPGENECHICQKIFCVPSELSKHLLTHSREKPYVCNICQERFCQQEEIKQHMITQHTQSENVLCNVCEKVFPNTAELEEHMMIHTTFEGKENSLCSVCGLMFANMDSHMQTHTERWEHQCPTCKKLYRSRANLTRHMKVHTGEKPYECQLCKKQFSQSGHLKKHKLTHRDEKPHECNICHKRFRLPHHLKQHHISMHGVKYECGICGREFNTEKRLTAHLHTHEDSD